MSIRGFCQQKTLKNLANPKLLKYISFFYFIHSFNFEVKTQNIVAQYRSILLYLFIFAAFDLI